MNAHRINAGLMPESSPSETGDFFVIEREEPEAILATVRELVTRRIPQAFGLDPREDVQVLTPMQKGALGVGRLNAELQALLNPAPQAHFSPAPQAHFSPAPQAHSFPRGSSVTRAGMTLRAGDRVMQMRNDYERGVFNGDIGRIVSVHEEERSVAVQFDERTVSYDWADLDEISLAYACSIHKSQGSEFPAVVVVLHTQHFVLLRRNLLYTAVTRGRRLTVIVGSRRAIAIAVKSVGTGERSTRLARRLASRLPEG